MASQNGKSHWKRAATNAQNRRQIRRSFLPKHHAGNFSMNSSIRPFRFVPTTLILLGALAGAARAQSPRDWMEPLQGDRKIAHVLNRLGFGPRPGDFERAKEMGIEQWIAWQLAPEKIDDARVERKLSVLKTLQMTPQMLMLSQYADKRKVAKAIKAKQNGQEGAPNKFKARRREAMTLIEEMGLEQSTSLQAVGELQLDKTTRAVESERQTLEVLVDFWSNHFNLDVKKKAVRALKIVDEREVIRPNALGKFRDLLGASAKSPAMLVYLDNASSKREMGVNRSAARRRKNIADAEMPADTDAKPKKRGGINENYARELMELHTLGSDGGYSQQDVQEVARCLTGWSVNPNTGQFVFRKFAHDDGEKTVLGTRIPAGGGIKDGEKVLDILASHPSTAKFIARKLCVRFVADEPPASLVSKAAKTFQNTDGDLRAVVKTIVSSREFFSTGSYRAKIKSPFEFSVSAIRALGGTVLVAGGSTPFGRAQLIEDGGAVIRPGKKRYAAKGDQKTLAVHIAEMGQPLFSYQAPTGYSEDSRDWVSTGALVSRLNYALALVGGEVRNVIATPTFLLKGVDEHDRAAMTKMLVAGLLAGDVSDSTRKTLQREIAGEDQTPVDRKKLAALILGSPEFQRR